MLTDEASQKEVDKPKQFLFWKRNFSAKKIPINYY